MKLGPDLNNTIHQTDCEGLLQVLKWRLNNKVTQQEFTLLYTEWLRRREICVEHKNVMNVMCFLGSKNQAGLLKMTEDFFLQWQYFQSHRF